MLLTCPQCQTVYNVPIDKAPEEKKVRCVSCRHIWTATKDDWAENDTPSPRKEPDKETAETNKPEQQALDTQNDKEKAEEKLTDDLETIEPAAQPVFENAETPITPDEADSAVDPIEHIAIPLDLNIEELDPFHVELAEELIFEQSDEDESLEIVELPEADEVQQAGKGLEQKADGEDEQSQDDIDDLFNGVPEDKPAEEENAQSDIDSLFDAPDTTEDTDNEEDENSQDDIDALFGNEGANDVPDDVDNQSHDLEEPADAIVSSDDVKALESLFGLRQPEEEKPKAERPPTDQQPHEPAGEKNAQAKSTFKTKLKGNKIPPIAFNPAMIKNALPFSGEQLSKFSGWLVYCLCLSGVMLGLIMGRHHVVQLVPGSAHLYKMAGLDVNLYAIEMHEISIGKKTEGKKISLSLTGKFKNISKEFKAIPPLIIDGVGKNGKRTYHWVNPGSKIPLSPEESKEFEIFMPIPPEQTTKLHISFGS